MNNRNVYKARRRLGRPCEKCGKPIEPGDGYMRKSYIDGTHQRYRYVEHWRCPETQGSS